MEKNMIEIIRGVNKNPDLWLFEAKEGEKKGYIFTYNFEKKCTYVHVDLREKIRARMKERNVVQKELGELVGIHQREVSRYLNNGTVPIRILERILAVLEIL